MRVSGEALVEKRQRLLEAGGELFSERGFNAVGTREICNKAGADIAAIHYHFGSKENLYREVLEYAGSLRVTPIPLSSDAGVKNKRDRLKAMVDWILKECFATGPAGWRWRFIERATFEPGTLFRTYFVLQISPMYDALDSICQEFLGATASHSEVRLATRSILGQCFHYRMNRDLIIAAGRSDLFSPQGLAQVTEHIVEFSVAGLKAQARRLSREGERQSVAQCGVEGPGKA